jgi:hypothetical protein
VRLQRLVREFAFLGDDGGRAPPGTAKRERLQQIADQGEK